MIIELNSIFVNFQRKKGTNIDSKLPTTALGLPGQEDKRKAPLRARHLFLLVTKASTSLPTRGHHIDAFAVCLGLFAPSFCDQEHYSKRNLDLASHKKFPTAFRPFTCR